MEYIAFISYGKDSLAMLEAINLLQLPLDRILTVDVWATSTIRGEFPEMVDFQNYVDKFIFNKYGKIVEHLVSDITYEEQFYKKRFSKKLNDEIIYGFPTTIGAWCNSRLKMSVINKFKKSTITHYIGIASDEDDRIFRHTKDNIILPLVLLGWTEQDCFDFCKKNNILSPVYNSSFRDGCWFCHNQGVNQLRNLRKNYPYLWDLLLKWDNDSPVSFKPNNLRVRDFDLRFSYEDKGFINLNNNFRWAMLNEPIQISFF